MFVGFSPTARPVRADHFCIVLQRIRIMLTPPSVRAGREGERGGLESEAYAFAFIAGQSLLRVSSSKTLLLIDENLESLSLIGRALSAQVAEEVIIERSDDTCVGIGAAALGN